MASDREVLIEATLFPSRRQLLPWDYFRFAREPPAIGDEFQTEFPTSHNALASARQGWMEIVGGITSEQCRLNRRGHKPEPS